ncbi:hypothetical protein EYF80_002103 [Liparis tanakae]|uniref:Uncharacterized protein n=1 Tax=Liparis tanakae TaxID=230148 RepID=A0A4Z2JC32_9TELE|nr:hypothetical protein EYF80_002103 [Liparis tanakae]
MIVEPFILESVSRRQLATSLRRPAFFTALSHDQWSGLVAGLVSNSPHPQLLSGVSANQHTSNTL